MSASGFGPAAASPPEERPWKAEEHARFLEALEKYGDGNTGNEWQYMAEYVGHRTPTEIKLHAHKYFIKLQAATQRRNRAVPAAAAAKAPMMSAGLDDRNWTKREDVVFENALATYDETSADRWTAIATLLPGKSADDIRTRYQKLLVDIARIESGEQVTLSYRPRKPLGLVPGRAALVGAGAQSAGAMMMSGARQSGGAGGGGGMLTPGHSSLGGGGGASAAVAAAAAALGGDDMLGMSAGVYSSGSGAAVGGNASGGGKRRGKKTKARPSPISPELPLMDSAPGGGAGLLSLGGLINISPGGGAGDGLLLGAELDTAWDFGGGGGSGGGSSATDGGGAAGLNGDASVAGASPPPSKRSSETSSKSRKKTRRAAGQQ